MLRIAKRTSLGIVAVAAIGLIPVVVLAANGVNSNARPANSHGPKKTPGPTIVVTPRPTTAARSLEGRHGRAD